MNLLFVGWLVFLVIAFSIVVIVTDAQIRKRQRQAEEKEREEQRKMFEASLRGELYIPQPRPMAW